MDYFKRMFAAAFVISALALAVAFLAGRRAVMSQPAEEVLWRESIAQLKALGDHKYRQSIHYIAYAKYAARDSLNAEAALFHAMSHADAVHCANCRKALEGLGGRASTPTITRTLFSSTADHLHHAHEDRHHTHTHLLPPAIAQSLADGNRYIARIITWCDASDLKMILLLRQVSAEGARGESEARCESDDMARCEVCYWVCPNCGNIVSEQMRTCYCPHCMTPGEEFVRFE